MTVSNNTNKERTDAPLATMAARIVQLASNPEVSLPELGELAAADPGFAVRLLGVANSAAFGVPVKVTNVKQAVTMLGVRGVRNLALGLVLSDMVPDGEETEILLANALRRAVACRLLAERLDERDVESYFTTGLLLESGILVGARKNLTQAIEFARTPAAHRVVRERAAGEDAHPELGAKLAADCGLPEQTAAAIRSHHTDEIPSERLARAAWAAEHLAGVYEGGNLSENRARAEAALEQLGMSAEVVDEVLRQLPEEMVEASRALQRDMGSQPDLDSLMQDANRSLVALNAQYEDLIRQLEAVLLEKEALNAKLERLASIDDLTELYNRRIFSECLLRDLARAEREKSPISLVLLDIDHFKQVNDTYGHQAGDDVLRAVARTVRAQIRAGDVAARYGGEEFAVILPSTDAAGAETLAERIRSAVEAATVETQGKSLRVTLSCGVNALSGADCRAAADALISGADTALYKAKDAGRNRVEIHSAAK